MPNGAGKTYGVIVGESVRRVRLDRGISVRKLAAKVGCSPSFISQVELSQAAPSIASLMRIAAVLGVTLGDLLDEIAPESSTAPQVSDEQRQNAGREARRGAAPPERRALPLGLEEQSALLSSVVFAKAPDGMAFIDPNFVIRAVNEAYAAQVDVPADQTVGRTMEDVFPGWMEQVKHIYEQVRETGEPFKSEAHPYIFKGGRERGITYWDVSISPVHRTDGVLMGYLLAHRDVTERTKAEQERQRLIEQLRKANAQLVLSSIPIERERVLTEAVVLES